MPYLAKLAARLAATWAPALVLVAALSPLARGQASQRVTVVVPEVESLAIQSGPVRLVFEAPGPDAPFADVTDASSAYAITVNTTGNKITGQLDAAFDARVRLRVRLEPPPGARSLGSVALGPAPRDLVADVSQTAGSGLTLTYTASADAGASAVDETRTVTYTVTDQ